MNAFIDRPPYKHSQFQEFLASENRCLLRVILQADSMENISPFRLENYRTNEMLELKHITEEQMKNQFNLAINLYHGHALLLERFVI